MVSNRRVWFRFFVLSAFFLYGEVCGASESTPGVAFTVPIKVLTAGDVERLEWFFTPPGPDEVTLSSSQPQVATVGKDGTVTALSEGITIILLETHDGRQAQMALRVKSQGDNRPG